MKKVAILQSNYIPWKGYFDIINDVDIFVFYDDVQYTKNDWRNRNKIKTRTGEEWLTIPTGTDLDRLICDVDLKNSRWQSKHWKSICQNYSKAPFFSVYKDFFEDLYLGKTWDNLSALNQYLIKHISTCLLGIEVTFIDSREFSVEGRRMDRLLEILRETDADFYLSGPAAKTYIDDHAFTAAGIELSYKDYGGYPVYPQFHPPFSHSVSILDLLFQTGPEAPYYIWGWRKQSSRSL